MVYAVFTHMGKREKISIGVKTYPTQWNSKRQLAIISNLQTELDNNNNRIVNERIKQVKQIFTEQKCYLCDNPSKIHNISEQLRVIINPKSRGAMRKKKPIVTYAMLDLIKDKKDSTANAYNNIISSFRKYLSSSNIDDTFVNMNQQTIEGYKEFLCTEELSVSTINTRLTCIKNFLKSLSKSVKYNYDYSQNRIDMVDKLSVNISHSTKNKKQVDLNEKEISNLYHLKNLSNVREETRDLFVLQCWTGQRVSDLCKLFNKEFKLSPNIVQFTSKKTEVDVIIRLNREDFGYDIQGIIDKYTSNGFKCYKIDLLSKIIDSEEQGKADKELKSIIAKYNRHLKSICKDAGLNRIINYKEQRGKKTIDLSKPLYELVHSHTARHSYVTNMLRRGVEKDTIKITTGHTDDQMIDKIYAHLNSDDKIKKLTEDTGSTDDIPIVKRTNTKVEIIEDNNYKYVRGINEAQKVLTFLGVSPTKWVDVEDFAELMAMIGRQEGRLMDKLGIETILPFKEIFNEEITMQERADKLKSLVDAIEKK